MTTTRIVAVAPDSPAASAGILVGDELLALNGERLRDVIRYQIQAEEPEVDVELRRGGVERSVVIRKPAGAPLGLELDAAVFDRVRTCDNHCPFCFIYQLPEGMRRSLYVKDDDYRLSFLYGNFTTLTRFTEADLERVVSERLSPIYVEHPHDRSRRAHRAVAQPARRHEPAVARTAARRGYRGARPDRVLPGRERRRGPRADVPRRVDDVSAAVVDRCGAARHQRAQP